MRKTLATVYKMTRKYLTWKTTLMVVLVCTGQWDALNLMLAGEFLFNSKD